MFEPLKLIALGLTLLLLAPFGFVFWRMFNYPYRPVAERRAELQAHLKERAAQTKPPGPGGASATAVEVTIIQSFTLSKGTSSWLDFYPRRWVAFLGFGAIALMIFCCVLSLFFAGPNAISDDTFVLIRDIVVILHEAGMDPHNVSRARRDPSATCGIRNLSRDLTWSTGPDQTPDQQALLDSGPLHP